MVVSVRKSFNVKIIAITVFFAMVSAKSLVLGQALVQNQYALFQNEPNPFKNGTSIAFVLPISQEVVLKFYDISGKEINEIKGGYRAGKNVVNLDLQPLLGVSNEVFYRLETEGFMSKMVKLGIQNW